MTSARWNPVGNRECHRVAVGKRTALVDYAILMGYAANAEIAASS
jgi:hypothetical protein